tara:strand:+ start:39 stop:578 length:540 start_codon:yes stop_codon:yes gene_type:complete
MASNYRVNFAVSLTPTIVNDAGQSVSTTALDSEIAKTLGGSGVVGDITAGDNVTMLADGTEVTGYGSGAAAYLSSNGSTGNGITVGDVNNITIIKNTGFEYSSSSVLGDALTKTSGVWTVGEVVEIKDTNNSGVMISRIYPGEAVVFPRAGNGVVFHCSSYSGETDIAIEYAIIVDGTS